MDDLLKRSAQAYNSLLPYRYHFTLGWKGQLRHISISFPIVAYYHLAGFHKVGMSMLSIKKKALNTVLSGVVTHAHFINAGANLEDRWTGICRLKEMIESNRMVFHYRGHEQPGSVIKGDYLMVFEDFAFFIAGDTPESIFAQGKHRYEQGCPRFTTLQISREDTLNALHETVYTSPSYRND